MTRAFERPQRGHCSPPGAELRGVATLRGSLWEGALPLRGDIDTSGSVVTR
jgi:hypothetical protein